MNTIKPSYNINDAAQVLGLCRQRIYDEINAKHLLSYKVGKRRFISGEAILQYIRDREAEMISNEVAHG